MMAVLVSGILFVPAFFGVTLAMIGVDEIGVKKEHVKTEQNAQVRTVTRKP